MSRPIKIDAPAKYEIWIDHRDGSPRSLLDHKGRSQFSRRTAIKYAREIQRWWAIECDIEIVQVYEGAALPSSNLAAL